MKNFKEKLLIKVICVNINIILYLNLKLFYKIFKFIKKYKKIFDKKININVININQKQII